jgi:threonylcarbamoyladenosine tRNA methylthiotransferase MtaB
MPTFRIEQFGCRATQADGAAIEHELVKRGMTVAADGQEADVVVFNTCTVTAAADAQAREAIRKQYARNPSSRIIATGCYAQRAPEELTALPGVAWVVGNSHKPEIPDLAAKLASAEAIFPAAALGELPATLAQGPAKLLTGDIFERNFVMVAPVAGGELQHTRPTLKIQDGCNNRCSYCVIPSVRGRSRSLPPERVIAEIQALCAAGSREVVLSGINLGAWGRDLSPRQDFLPLLRRILAETEMESMRVSSIEPMDVTADFVELFAENSRLASHFHMPLQSASNRILAAMRRWYRAEHYARRVEWIHDRLPHAAIGADVIVGFPGETENEFAATRDFIESLPFSYLHVFSFSSRPGTKAATLPNELPPTTVRRRARELRALGERKAEAFRKLHIGTSLRVLTLRGNERDSTPALSGNYLRVRVGASISANEWLTVRITGEERGCLTGGVDSAASTLRGRCNVGVAAHA